MPISRTRKYTLAILSLLAVMAAVLVGAFLYLPHYIETRLIPRLAHTAGLSAHSVRVGPIGLSGADLGPLRLDGPEGPVLRVERLHLSYSPATLWHRRIGRVTLQGLKASLRIADGALFIGDTRLAPPDSAQAAREDPAGIPALPFRHLAIEDALLEIAWNGGHLQVPFSATVNATGADEGQWSADALLTPRRSRLHLSAVLDAARGQADLVIKELQASLEDWVDLIPALVPPAQEGSARGQLTLRGSAALGLTPFNIAAATADIGITALALDWNPLPASGGPAEADEPPISLRLDTAISLSGAQRPDGLAARGTVALRDITLRRGPSTLTGAGWRLAGEALWGDDLRLELQGEGSAARLVHESMTFSLPLTTVEALVRSSAAGLAVQGRAAVRSAGLIDTARDLSLRDITVELPFAWPPPEASREGRLTVAGIDLQQQRLGDLSGRLQQHGQGLRFDLDHRSQLFPKLVVHIKGTADAAGAAAEIQVPDYRPAAPIDLGRFVSAAGGFVLGGRFQAQGRLRWSAESTRTEADLRIAEGTLRDVNGDLQLTGIQSRLRLDDLLALQSPAGQRLRVERIQLGKISASALEVTYRIAPLQRLLIETAGADWCGGRIESGPIELSPDKPAIEAVVSARDLNLAQLLEQLDLAEGSGEGTVRGRVPIRWADQKLTFGKGALASPPGESGIIRLKELQGTQDLLAGLPAETPQHTQLDIAMEALKDYTYRSIDLQVESQEEILVLRLQLAGKPNRMLPFAYDQELGRLKRVQGKGQADFQGIDIDLNFRSPLNQLLNYRELLKSQ